ncbi:MAG: PEP/pyruvate-binding domain-containing protein [Saprospiraceae bacterium]
MQFFKFGLFLRVHINIGLSFITGIICFLTSISLQAQTVDPAVIKARIESYKIDARGPYRDIRWFCKDGTTVAPHESCGDPAAVQRARMKDDVIALGESNHIYLGQILSTTDKEEFWDEENGNSRIKQYELGKYLQSIDDGWVLRKGQYYRGAYQVEDEETWGIDFYKWLITRERLEHKFFLIRQTARDIAHRGDDDKTLNIRAISKTLSESFPDFMDLRVKIHGQPTADDVGQVVKFRDAHQSKLSSEKLSEFNELIRDMKSIYDTRDLVTFCPYLDALPTSNAMKAPLTNFVDDYVTLNSPMSRAMALADNIMVVRENINSVKSPVAKLHLLDMSLRLEELFLVEMSSWHAITISDLLDKICYEGLAATGAGFLEKWEWDRIVDKLSLQRDEEIPMVNLQDLFETGRHMLEWGTGMVRAEYGDVVNQYAQFEPLSRQFLDDRIRSSALLPLGESVSALGNILAREDKVSNNVLGIKDQGFIRGLNPGYARGELVVISGDAENVDIAPNKIYVFERPPSGLKPVAGIATVSEGSLISHIQLLARNLGIPNAALSGQNLEALKKYSGKEIFYAVSPRGTVVMKKAEDMSAPERALFKVKSRAEEKIRVPVDKLDLSQTHVLDLRTVNASHSGKICGPKAANLGQLKSLFPDHVVEGIVIPFGIFRKHMDQLMPGQSISYWNFLQNTFQQAEQLTTEGKPPTDVESFTLNQLAILQLAIKTMKFTDDFIGDLNLMFQTILGTGIGKLPVFVRSDTNMEDLKDFTGAGLNLTVFNVLDKDKIMQAIRDVWASPYTDRSFKWRQHYLLNPENVFPSILIIPSVNNECSGVMVTKGVQTGRTDDNTIAFSRGVGGAVDGQSAESWVLQGNGDNKLMAPSREPTYKVLPLSGGTETVRATFDERILSLEKLKMLRSMAGEVRRKLPGSTGIETSGPFDMELGFKDGKIWLFQVRPFVENKNATVSDYLESISPKNTASVNIKLLEKL